MFSLLNAYVCMYAFMFVYLYVYHVKLCMYACVYFMCMLGYVCNYAVYAPM